MATKLYLSWAGVEVSPRNAGVAIRTDPSFWDGLAGSGYLDGGGAWALKIAAEASAASSTRASVTGPTSGICGGVWVSNPVAAAFTLSGTVTFSIWARETVSAANMGLIARLYKVSGTDGTLTQVVGDSIEGSELTTSDVEKVWTATPSSTAVEIGDRMMLFLGFDDAGGTMASGASGRITYGGADATTGDSFVQLNEDVTFLSPSTPAGTKLYLLSQASDVDDGNDEREMWTAAGSSTDTSERNTATGPTSALEWTKTAGGSVVRWYSRALDSFTLSGAVRVRVRVVANAANLFSFAYAELARVDNDGANPMVWAWGVLASNGNNPSNAIQTTTNEHYSDLVGAPLAFAGGQRVRLRLFVDENYVTNDDMVGSSSITLTFNGAADADQSWLQLTETVDEWDGPPGPVPGPYRIQPAAVY